MKKIFSGALALMTLLVVTSCSKYPQVEIDAAQAAIDSARVAQADIYATAEFNALVDSFNVVTLQVQEEEGKLISNYEDLRVRLTEVTTNAQALVTLAAERKEQVRLEAVAVLAQLDTLLLEANALVVKAPRGKDGAAALEAIKSEIAVIETAKADANNLLAAGDFITARDRATAAQGKLVAITEELNAAIAARAGRRR